MDKKEYYIYVKGKAVPVSEEVYKVCWKITEQESISKEKNVEVKMQIKKLNKALATLTKEERV